jgi:hypothetical protein
LDHEREPTPIRVENRSRGVTLAVKDDPHGGNWLTGLIEFLAPSARVCFVGDERRTWNLHSRVCV